MRAKMHKILSVLLSVMLVLGTIPATGIATYAVASHVYDGITFEPWESTTSLPSSAGDYYLTGDVTISSTWTVPGGTTNLDLSGHGIRMTGWGSVISVGNGAKLIINDSDTDTTHKFDVPNGAGLAALNEASGNYTVNGGYITGGDADNGGGIYIGEYGEVVMNGGALIGNQAEDNGAGIRMESYSSFTLNGGEIAYNHAFVHGGGLGLAYTNHTTITVNDGEIHHNICECAGGAITLDNDPDSYLYLYGGAIRDNASVSGSGNNPWHPGGIAGNGNVHIKGAAQVYNNINLSSSNNGTARHNIEINTSENDLITLDGPLSKGARIAVSYHTGGNKSTGVLTSDWSKYMGDADPAEYFVSDYDDYIVSLSGGEAAISVPPAASVTSGGSTVNYATLSEAVSAWTAGSTLKLISDVTTNSTVTVPSGAHTLDLNGHALKAASSGYSVVTVGSGAELVIKDSTDGGKITGGSVGQNYGGGITVDGGTLTLQGGTISGNANTYNGIGNCGGGVHVKNSGKFYMEGGEISGNTSYVGGAVCSDQSATTVSITGGVITNNRTDRFGSAVWAGRNNSAVFRIGGDVQIIDNISTWTGDKDGEGTINFVYSTLSLSGNPVIRGSWKSSGSRSPNTHINLDNDGSGIQRIKLDGALTNDTGSPAITLSPIYRWNDMANGQTFVFTSGWSTYMGTAHPADFFKVDDSVTGVRVIRKDGEAALTGGSALGDFYIFFDANNGDGAMDPQLATAASVTLNENAFTRSGYGFIGWNTKADGTGTGYDDNGSVTLTGDLTLFAQWEPGDDLFEGKGTEAEPYLIQSADDWDALSRYINNGGTRYRGKHFKLTQNISVTTVLGNRPNTSSDSEDNYFSGTFDGDGHTLEVAISNSGFAAPFGVAHNATIQNLHVTGTVTSTANHASGLVAASKGRSVNDIGYLKIRNVTVSADIRCNSHVAGIVGHAHGATITMENVVFDGSISASSVQGGFIGWGGLTNNRLFSATLKDCVFMGTYRSGAAFYPVAYQSGQGTVTLTNDFYTTSLGSGGSPVPNTGSGQVKLFVATVEKDGAVNYYDNFATATSSANWTVGSTLKLFSDVTTSSTVTATGGAKTLDLNGHELKRTGGSGNNDGVAVMVKDAGDLTILGPGRITGGFGWHGGGVHVAAGCSAVLDNCEISGNNGHYGGGLYLGGGTITLRNGTVVKGNSAIDGFGGPGIYAENYGTLIMENATFTENEVRDGGKYAVFLCGNATLQVSGASVITGNTYNGEQRNLFLYQSSDQDSKVTISGELPDGAHIGVRQMNGAGTFSSGWKSVMGDAEPSRYFVSDNADYEVRLENGEAILAYPYLTGVSAANVTCDYDGKGHAISVTAPEGATVTYGTQAGDYSLTDSPAYSDAGTYTVYYKVSKNKYTAVTGSATVTVSPINATVTVTGHTASVAYDGKSHTVSGYDAVASTALYDVTKDIVFSGTAAVSRTDAGMTNMGLKASQFENKNGNFATVTFNVTDGYVTVVPINVTVTVTGHTAKADFNGEAHSVSGYDVSFSNDLYTEADFTFSGNDTAETTHVGTTYMGLSPNQFENLNPNFATVTFDVTDGYVTIDPIDTTVIITGHTETVDYDGTAHTVTGYDVTFCDPLYTEADFTFSGTADVSRTDAGTAYMGLSAEQFENQNPDFATVLFDVIDGSVTVDPIDVTVTVTGHTASFDYDGQPHTALGYDAVASTALYDVTQDMTFDAVAVASRDVAGTTYMGLSAEQFENTNANFATVTFDVTDGFVTITPIDMTVTVTGHTGAFDYDGTAHSVSGYDAVADTDFYDVTKDFSFSGTADVDRTDAGTTAMGLSAEQFENTNANFANVTFEVTDGSVTVNPVDAVITDKPHAKASLVYTGNEQELLEAGTAVGGTLLYAVAADADAQPADADYSTALPTGTQVGNYYIWYKVEADANHLSLTPAYVKITLAEPEWVTITGSITQSDGTAVPAGSEVSLMQGSTVIDSIKTTEDGGYYFTVPAGAYNLVVTVGGSTETIMVDAGQDAQCDISISASNTHSVLSVVSSDKSIVVGGLDGEAQAIRASEEIPADEDVTVRMTVTAIAANDAAGSAAIRDHASDRNLEYYDLKVEKTVNAVTTAIDTTQTVIEVVIPFAYTGKREVMVYYADDAGVHELTESDSGEAGTFRIDADTGMVHVFSDRFTTYAVGYKPYYQVQTQVALGSYEGDVTVMLTHSVTGETYTLAGVSLEDISFTDIPKGVYTMTVTWEDGVENTLSLPFTIE